MPTYLRKGTEDDRGRLQKKKNTVVTRQKNGWQSEESPRLGRKYARITPFVESLCLVPVPGVISV